MKITLKKMETPEEIRGKAFVHWKSWHQAYPGIVSPQALEKLTLERCEEIAFNWPDNLIIARNGEQVIGFVGYGHRDEEPEGTGEIFALYVLEEYHGTGIGKKLMEAGLRQLKDCPEICLWTLKENRRAIRFYHKCGFREDGREKLNDYLKAVEIRMTLER